MENAVIVVDDPRREDVRSLLERHLAFANDHTPPEDVHALDIDALIDPAITFFSLRLDGDLLGVGAMKHIEKDHVELKSMHTASAARGKGVGRAMVQHLLDVASERKVGRVSLETGSSEAFAAARSLYTKAGFVECEPFGSYEPSPNSVFMTVVLTGRSQSSGM